MFLEFICLQYLCALNGLFRKKRYYFYTLFGHFLVELFGALRARLYDSNKNLIMATLTSISGLASAMGPAIEKASKVKRYTYLHLFINKFGLHKPVDFNIYTYALTFLAGNSVRCCQMSW